jgi:hypothetical protein
MNLSGTCLQADESIIGLLFVEEFLPFCLLSKPRTHRRYREYSTIRLLVL